MPIQDGFKVIVCKLKPNPLGLTSVAYPVDQLILPQWFKDLPFDDELIERSTDYQKNWKPFGRAQLGPQPGQEQSKFWSTVQFLMEQWDLEAIYNIASK